MVRLSSMLARVKLKGIDGDPHKRWSMWFNSTQREEPYQVLTSRWPDGNASFSSEHRWQVVHGCRQLVSWDVGLSPATSATLIASYYARGLWRDCRWQNGGRWGWRQIIMPLMTWATHVLQWLVQSAAKRWRGANLKKPISVRIVVCNSTTWSWNR